MPADRARAGQRPLADHPPGADHLPGLVRVGDPAGRRAVDHAAAHDRRDPDRDDERPAAGAIRAAARRGRHMSVEPEQPEVPVLALDHLSLSFGGLRALSELDLRVDDREIVSLIGPNGAGKTTVFNVITGVYRP